MENIITPSSNEIFQNSMVGIFLPITNLEHIIPYFISHRIPFSINYDTNIELEKLNKVGTEVMEPKNLSLLDNEYNSEKIAREVYKIFIENANFKNPPTESVIAKKYGISVPTLRKKLKIYYNKTLYQLYLDKRMEKARELLLKGYTCTQVSEAVGYGKNSSIKFNKMFQKHFKITPKKFQISNLNYYSF